MRQKIVSVTLTILLVSIVIVLMVRTTASPNGELVVDFTENGSAVQAKVYRKSSFWNSGSLTEAEVKNAVNFAQSKYAKKTKYVDSEIQKSGLLIIGVRPRVVEVNLQIE